MNRKHSRLWLYGRKTLFYWWMQRDMINLIIVPADPACVTPLFLLAVFFFSKKARTKTTTTAIMTGTIQSLAPSGLWPWPSGKHWKFCGFGSHWPLVSPKTAWQVVSSTFKISVSLIQLGVQVDPTTLSVSSRQDQVRLASSSFSHVFPVKL